MGGGWALWFLKYNNAQNFEEKRTDSGTDGLVILLAYPLHPYPHPSHRNTTITTQRIVEEVGSKQAEPVNVPKCLFRSSIEMGSSGMSDVRAIKEVLLPSHAFFHLLFPGWPTLTG